MGERGPSCELEVLSQDDDTEWADLSTYFCNVRFWGAGIAAIATGMGAKRNG